MEQVATPFDCDGAPRPVMIRVADCPSLLTYPPHSHHRAELVYVRSGTVCVTIDGAMFIVPSQCAILIAPDTVHEVRMLSDAHLLTTYLAVPRDKPGLACGNLLVSDLLRELMHAAVDLPVAYDRGGREERIMDLIAEEVAWLTAKPDTLTLQTPVPTNPRLVRLCREILRELDRGWTIDDAAEVAGMGRRTFTRAFKREVGISFNTWRSRARLNAAVCRLKAGASITSVALEAGYSNPSAFATMFKRCLGVPPSHFQIARTVRLAS